MAGLLKKLNKRPRTEGARSSARITRLPSGAVSTPNSPMTPAPAPTNSPWPQRTTTSNELRANASTATFDAKPWWVVSPPEYSTTLAAVIPVARSLLDKQIGSTEVDDDELRRAIHRALIQAQQAVQPEVPLSQRESEEATRELIDFLRGKGPLQPLYDDPAVTDIYLDGHESVRCRRAGKVLDTPFRFRGIAEYEDFTQKLLKAGGIKIESASPLAYCVLPDAWRTRVHAVHASLLDAEESSLALRIQRMQQITFYEMLRAKVLPATVAAWLSELVSNRAASILIFGPPGSGKTTFCSALLSAVNSADRVITIEQVPEIAVSAQNIEKMLVRGKDSLLGTPVEMRDLVQAALRRAPSRLALADVGPKERGSVCDVISAGVPFVAVCNDESPRDGLWGLVEELGRGSVLPLSQCLRKIATPVPLVITLGSENGRPFVRSIAEVAAPLEDDLALLPILEFSGEIDGKRRWRIVAPDSYWMELTAQHGSPLRAGPALDGVGS